MLGKLRSLLFGADSKFDLEAERDDARRELASSQRSLERSRKHL